jgi:hypothetical protein
MKFLMAYFFMIFFFRLIPHQLSFSVNYLNCLNIVLSANAVKLNIQKAVLCTLLTGMNCNGLTPIFHLHQQKLFEKSFLVFFLYNKFNTMKILSCNFKGDCSKVYTNYADGYVKARNHDPGTQQSRTEFSYLHFFPHKNPTTLSSKETNLICWHSLWLKKK